MFLTFTPEELEELRRFDAEIDAAPMEYEDYLISNFVEALLFPERERERAKRRERERRTYERDAEKRRQYQREYRAAHKEEAAARKRAYYEANRGAGTCPTAGIQAAQGPGHGSGEGGPTGRRCRAETGL